MKTSISVLACAALLAGCATTTADGRPLTAVQRAQQRCLVSVGVGAVIGALANADNRRTGALTGAALGGVVCGVMVAMANEQDRAEIARLQAEALEKDERVTAQYVGEDGRERHIETRSYAAPALVLASATSAAAVSTTANASAPATPRVCRYVETRLTVANVGSTQTRDLLCRNPATSSWDVQPGSHDNAQSRDAGAK